MIRATSLVRFVAVLVLGLGASLVSGGEIAGAGPLPRVVPGEATVLEGDSGPVVVQVPVTLSEPSTVVVTVDWVTIFGPDVRPPAPAEPGVDFEAVSGTVTFDPGVTAATIEITVYGDVVEELDEYVVAAFSNPTNATVGGFWGLGFGVIDDDDAPPVVVPGVGTVREGDSGTEVVQVPVTLSEPSTAVVTVDWVTIFGPDVRPPAPAEPGVDFEAASGTVIFDPGVTAATIEITVYGDVVEELDEYIVAAFSNPINATVGGFWGLGFGIIDTDDNFAFAVPFGPVLSPIGTGVPGCEAAQPLQFTGDFSSFGLSDIAVQLCIGEGDPAAIFPILSGSLIVTSGSGVLTGEVTGGHIGPIEPNPFPLVVDFDISGGTGAYTGAVGAATIVGTFQIVSFTQMQAFGMFTGMFTIPA